MTGVEPHIFWIASFPRSGSTWVRMYLYCLMKILRSFDAGQNINLLRCFSPSDADRIYYGKYLKWSLQTSIKDVAAVRHLAQRDIAQEVNEFAEESNGLVFAKTNWMLGEFFGHRSIDVSLAAGAAYLIRNPLDVAVSLAHHMNQPIDTAIDFMCMNNAYFAGDSAAVLTGSWSQNVASWTRNDRQVISVLRYEDLLDDVELWFTVLTRQIFGDRAVVSDSIRRAIEQCSFQHLQAQEEEDGYAGTPPGVERFFRAGRAGQWRDGLTSLQVERILDCHAEQMKRFGYFPVA